MPCTAGKFPTYHIVPEGSLQWWVHSLLQYQYQKCCATCYGEYTFHGGPQTQTTTYNMGQ